MSLTGKVALVTGSARGIGAATVRMLASRGASVVINYANSSTEADALAKELESKHDGIKAIAIKADLGSVDGPKHLADETVKVFKQVDILVHNAGIMPDKAGWDATPEVYDAVMNTNVRGPYLLTQALVPSMPKGSSILFFSTGVTKMTGVPPTYILYIMSKGATEQAVRGLCRALGPKGIRVNAIAPGPTATELFLKPKTPEQIEFFAKQSALGRLGEVDDIAKTVSFLVSDEAGWVNGQTLHCNGGLAI